jgi:cardiolipin synthase
MKLVVGQQYYQELLSALPLARRRITLAAMIVAEGTAMHRIFEEVEAAARRGVAVHVLVDIYTGHWLARVPGMERWRVTRAAFDRIVATGGQVHYYGRLGLNPVAGRCHVKVAVIDDAAYCFGGINLTDIAFEQTDYMLANHDAGLADQLDELVQKIAGGQASVDLALPFDARSTLLYDAGLPHRSVIFERACQLTAAASQVYYVSQYGPSGRLGRIMPSTAQLYFNRIWQMSPPGNLLLMRDKARYRLRNLYTRSDYLHAKFMLFEMRDGTKALIAGSNNFNWDAVTYGTKEIALYSTDEALWQGLYDYLQTEVA